RTAALLRRAPHGETGHHRLGADQLSLRRLDRRRASQARIRPLLRQELYAFSRPPYPAADAAGGNLAGGCAMTGAPPMSALWPVVVQLVYVLCAGAALALGGWLL